MPGCLTFDCMTVRTSARCPCHFAKAGRSQFLAIRAMILAGMGREDEARAQLPGLEDALEQGG